MKEWRLESFGERWALRLGPPGSAPPSADDGLSRVLAAARSRRLKPGSKEPVVAIFETLTRRAFPPWEPMAPSFSDSERQVRHLLASAIRLHQLEISRVALPLVPIRFEEEKIEVPENLAPAKEEALSNFRARLLDEIGEPIAGIELAFTSQGKSMTATTDGQGVAKFEGFEGSFGTVKIKDPSAIEKAMAKKWELGRIPVQVPNNIPLLRFGSKLPDVRLEAGLELPIVIRPEMGKLSLRLRDKSGRHRHAAQKYSIRGPVTFDGETDETGALFHETIPPGDYELTFTQSFESYLASVPTLSDEEKSLVVKDLKSRGLEPTRHTTALVALAESQSVLQERWLGAVPEVSMARLRGMVFDTNKTFLLPTAVPSLSKIRAYYEKHAHSKLLIVGHTDTSGGEKNNDELSKKRAESVKQFLEDDVDGWLKNFSSGAWGAREERLMMTQLEGFSGKNPKESPALWYQKHHNARAKFKNRPELKADGKMGPKTRGELVRDYMALDGTTLGQRKDFDISIELHGCGENFPLDATGIELDSRLAAERDGEKDLLDRRVELFFFDPEFGPTPKPSGPKGKEYLVWRKLAGTVLDNDIAAARQKATVVQVPSAHYRTGSAVLLPEGESPTAGAGTATSSVGMLAMALRFNEERPGHSMLLAGHADSVGSDKSNDKLSEKRAELTHAVLMGNRDKFVEIANETGKVSDWKQIFRWASAAVPGFEKANPATIDDAAATGSAPAKAFQEAYNANKSELGISGDDLKPDGVVGKKTWGAIFDLYQWNMAEELGEVEEETDLENPTKRLEGLKKLQGLVSFLPTSKPFIGFGEHFPVDGIGKDGLASVANRRVEVMFFEQGHEPDVGILNEAPDVSELYQAESYERVKLRAPNSARRIRYAVRVLDWKLEPMANSPCVVRFGEQIFDLVTDRDGLARFGSPELLESCEAEWRPGGEDGPTVQRTLVFSDRSDLDARLRNLGYAQDAEENTDAFRLEFALDERADTSNLLRKWHDDGIRPNGSTDA